MMALSMGLLIRALETQESGKLQRVCHCECRSQIRPAVSQSRKLWLVSLRHWEAESLSFLISKFKKDFLVFQEEPHYWVIEETCIFQEQSWSPSYNPPPPPWSECGWTTPMLFELSQAVSLAGAESPQKCGLKLLETIELFLQVF